MALNKQIEKILNDQINNELWSAYLYLSMSAYFSKIGLPGFASWMKIQYHEENQHAMRIFDYILERSGVVTLMPIEKVETSWNDVLDVFEQTLEHEKKVTKMINESMKLAVEKDDYATINMLQWFVDEQVGEEAIASDIIDRLKLFNAKGSGLFYMDQKMGQRAPKVINNSLNY